MPVTGLLILLLTGLATLWLAGVAFVAWILTHPVRRTYAGAVSRGRPGDPSELPGSPRKFESWTLESRGLRLPVWEVTGDQPSGPVVILTHGWGDSRVGGLIRLEPFLLGASRVILWDLPGHGEAEGFSKLGTAEVDDLLALIERVGPERLLLYGWSLGAGIALAAAPRVVAPVQLAGIIAESPYALAQTPALRVARARGLPASTLIAPAFLVLRMVLGSGLSSRAFDRRGAAAKVRAPVLVIHGEADEISPVEDGRQIAAACNGTLLELPGGGHNDLWSIPLFSNPCIAGIEGFMASLNRGRAG